MKCNAWTLALIGAGLVSVPAVTRADESTNSVLTALSATTISGYVSTSAEWTPGPGDVNPVAIPYNKGKTDGFNLDVVKLTIEKDVVPTDSWGAGYRADLLFGPDAVQLNTQSPLGAQGDFGIDQAYLALHAPVGNGLDFKFGVWNTIIGYEVFDSPNDPNFTRSWGYALEPTVHTGVLATYQICDDISASFGIANSFGNQVNGRSTFATESFKTYMGSLTYTAPTNMAWLGGSTATGCIITGNNAGLASAPATTGGPTIVGENETSYYFGVTMNTPMTCLKVGFAADLLDPHNDFSGKTWAIGGYVALQATEKLSFNGRAEYLENRNPVSPFVDSLGAVTMPSRATEITLTAQYDLWKNVLSRVEFRWDHDAGGPGVWGGSVLNGSGAVASGTPGPGPGEGNLKNMWLLAANLVYKF